MSEISVGMEKLAAALAWLYNSERPGSALQCDIAQMCQEKIDPSGQLMSRVRELAACEPEWWKGESQ